MLPPRDPAHTAEVRIFTPRAEMPFAGHPNVGTAFVLGGAATAGRGDPLLFEEKAGLVRARSDHARTAVVGARLAAPQPLAAATTWRPRSSPRRARSPPRHRDGTSPPCSPRCGTAASSSPSSRRARRWPRRGRAPNLRRRLPIARATGIHALCQAESGGFDSGAHVRAALRRAEDPATGSANVALVGLLAESPPGARLTLATAHRPGRRHGPAEPAGSLGRKAGRQAHRPCRSAAAAWR